MEDGVKVAIGIGAVVILWLVAYFVFDTIFY